MALCSLGVQHGPSDRKFDGKLVVPEGQVFKIGILEVCDQGYEHQGPVRRIPGQCSFGKIHYESEVKVEERKEKKRFLRRNRLSPREEAEERPLLSTSSVNSSLTYKTGWISPGSLICEEGYEHEACNLDTVHKLSEEVAASKCTWQFEILSALQS